MRIQEGNQQNSNNRSKRNYHNYNNNSYSDENKAAIARIMGQMSSSQDGIKEIGYNGAKSNTQRKDGNAGGDIAQKTTAREIRNPGPALRDGKAVLAQPPSRGRDDDSIE
jgi:hypothetical protein